MVTCDAMALFDFSTVKRMDRTALRAHGFMCVSSGDFFSTESHDSISASATATLRSLRPVPGHVLRQVSSKPLRWLRSSGTHNNPSAGAPLALSPSNPACPSFWLCWNFFPQHFLSFWVSHMQSVRADRSRCRQVHFRCRCSMYSTPPPTASATRRQRIFSPKSTVVRRRRQSASVLTTVSLAHNGISCLTAALR